MKFYSEVTTKCYDTIAECEKAEAEQKAKDAKAAAEREAKNAKRKEAADKIENALKERNEAYSLYLEACKAYDKELRSFCEKYGSYHMSFSSKDLDSLSLFNLLDIF